MKRFEILDQARLIVTGEREQEYGAPEDSFETTGILWGAYMRAAHPEHKNLMFTPKDVAVMLGCLKIARIARGDKADSFIDLAGYAACAGEIATREKDAGSEFVKVNQCVTCGKVIPEGEQFCLECKSKAEFITSTLGKAK